MRILYNGLCINKQLSGVQSYAERLLHYGIKDDGGHDFLPLLSRGLAYETGIGKGSAVTPIHADRRIRRIGFEHTMLQKIYKQTRSDLLHCPSYILPWRFQGGSVVTVHDTIALDYPGYCKNSNAAYFRLTLGHSIRNATRIIAVSNRVKEDILCRFDVPPEKIAVVYHGVDPIFTPCASEETVRAVRQKYGLPAKYILFVGNVEPKKNLDNLLRAFHIIRPKLEEGYKLVVAGQLGWKYRSFFQLMGYLNLKEHIILTGYVPKEDLPALYISAALFVFPSLYEGFGCPPMEAMACGTPVLLSRAGALPEIYPDFCTFVDPHDPNDIAGKMEFCLTNEKWRQECRQKGLIHAGRFSWEKTWQQTLQVYLSI